MCVPLDVRYCRSRALPCMWPARARGLPTPCRGDSARRSHASRLDTAMSCHADSAQLGPARSGPRGPSAPLPRDYRPPSTASARAQPRYAQPDTVCDRSTPSPRPPQYRVQHQLTFRNGAVTATPNPRSPSLKPTAAPASTPNAAQPQPRRSSRLKPAQLQTQPGTAPRLSPGAAPGPTRHSSQPAEPRKAHLSPHQAGPPPAPLHAVLLRPGALSPALVLRPQRQPDPSGTTSRSRPSRRSGRPDSGHPTAGAPIAGAPSRPAHPKPSGQPTPSLQNGRPQALTPAVSTRTQTSR